MDLCDQWETTHCGVQPPFHAMGGSINLGFEFKRHPEGEKGTGLGGHRRPIQGGRQGSNPRVPHRMLPWEPQWGEKDATLGRSPHPRMNREQSKTTNESRMNQECIMDAVPSSMPWTE